MSDDLVIDIGANLSNYTSALLSAEKQFNKLSKKLSAPQHVGGGSAKEFTKEMKEIKKEAKNAFKSVKRDVADALDISGPQKSWTKKQKAMVTAYARHYQRAMVSAVDAVAREKERVALKSAAFQRKVWALQERQALAQGKAVSITQRQSTGRGSGSKWGNIESFKHAAKTTALYGGMAQVLFGVQNAFSSAFQEMARFDQGLKDNQAVLQVTAAESLELSNTVTEIGIKYGASLSEIQEGMITFGRAGVDEINLLKAGTESLAALSVVTGDAMQYGAKAMASMIAVYPKLKNSMGGLANKMGAVANATRLGLEDFTTISNYALTAAKTIGLTSDSYLTLLGSMSKVGVSASSIGTSVARFTKLLADDSKALRSFYDYIGVSQKKFAQQMKADSETALPKFLAKLVEARKNTDAWREKTGGLEIRMRKLLDTLGLMGEQHVFKNMTEEVKKAKSVIDQARLAGKSLSKTWISFKNTITDTLHKLTPMTTNWVKSLIPSNGAVESTLAPMITIFANLVTMIDKVAVAFASWFIIGKLTALFGALSTIVVSTSSVMTTFTAVTSRALGLFTKQNILVGVITGAYWLWNKSQIAAQEEQATLASAMDLTNEKFKQLTISVKKITVRTLKKSIAEATVELAKLEKGLSHSKRWAAVFGSKAAGEMTDDIQAQIEKRKKSISEMTNQLEAFEVKLMYSVESAKSLSGALETSSINASSIAGGGETAAQAIGGAANEAARLARNLQMAMSALGMAMRGWQVASGVMHKYQAAYENMAESVSQATVGVTLSPASLRLGGAGGVAEAQTKILKIQAGYAEDMKNWNKEGLDTALKDVSVKLQSASLDAQIAGDKQAQLKTDIKIAELAVRTAKAKLEYGGTQTAVIEAENKLKKTQMALNKSLEKSGGGGKKAAKKAAKEALEEAEKFTGAFTSLFDKMLSGDWSNLFKDFFQSIGKTMMKPFIESMSKKLSNMLSSMTSGMDMFGQFAMGGLLSIGGAMLGSLFHSTLSEAELKAAKGRVEFDDDSLKNLQTVFEEAQYPMLKVTNSMNKHLRNMDENFYAVARAFSANASAAGIDLTGANFVGEERNVLFGLFSSKTSLIGTGLQFEIQNLGDMMDEAALKVRAYTTTRKDSSFLFGLFSSSSIHTSYKDLPDDVIKDMSNSFSEGYMAILEAGVSLGLNEANLQTQLLASNIDIGKVDFTGLSQEEIQNRISQLFGTALSGVVDGISGFSLLVDRYAKNTEKSLETLIRIATEYDQASHVFGLLGKSFADGPMINITRTWVEDVDVLTLGVAALGEHVNRFAHWNELASTSTTEHITHMEELTEVYTAQMQILDIVKSTGGLTQFNDAMTAFMTGFYTDSEQLGFMTKSLKMSFETLNIAMPKTNDEFRSLLENMDTTTEEGSYLYGQVLLLAESFNAMTTASENLGTSMTDMIQNVSDAWLGNLSYLTLQQKAEYASGMLRLGLTDSTGTINSVETAQAAAEIALKTTATKAEYIPIFNAYIKALEDEVEDASRTDLLNELRELKAEVVELRSATVTTYIHTGTD